MTECAHCSAAVLHKQWAKLEDAYHELAIAIDAARAKNTEIAQMRERQQSLLLEIISLVNKIRNAPATTIEDFAALLDVALEHEIDLACEMAFYGPADYPIIIRLLSVLAHEIPGFEFNSLRRWLSGQRGKDWHAVDGSERPLWVRSRKPTLPVRNQRFSCRLRFPRGRGAWSRLRQG